MPNSVQNTIDTFSTPDQNLMHHSRSKLKENITAAFFLNMDFIVPKVYVSSVIQVRNVGVFRARIKSLILLKI